jgi:hypothetical protein
MAKVGYVNNQWGRGEKTSCRQILRELHILPVASTYISEIVCYIKTNKANLKHNV